MQSHLFEITEVQAVANSAEVRFPWWKLEPAKPRKLTADMFGGADEISVERFHSGATARWDMAGYILAGAPVGVTASEINEAGLDHVARTLSQYTSKGGRVFVDSGAFGAWASGNTLDFAWVFNVYDTLTLRCRSTENLLLVMPDKVGDAPETQRLQMQHAARIRHWMAMGAECMFPIHSPDDDSMLETVKQIAQDEPYTIGIPSRASAWTQAETVAFCKRHQPARVHLLGLAKEERINAICAEIARVSPGTVVSCDSCSLIAHAGEGRRLTDRTRTRLESIVQEAELDGIEEVGIPSLAVFLLSAKVEGGFLTDREVTTLAKAVGTDPKHLIKECKKDDGLMYALSALDPDEDLEIESQANNCLRELYAKRVAEQVGGVVRAFEVSRLAIKV